MACSALALQASNAVGSERPTRYEQRGIPFEVRLAVTAGSGMVWTLLQVPALSVKSRTVEADTGASRFPPAGRRRIQIDTVTCWKTGQFALHWVLIQPSAGLASKAGDYRLTVIVREP